MFAVEVYLDADADARVRRIWSALDARGITSLGSIPDTDYHPHVSLAVGGDVDNSQVAEALKPRVADCRGMPLTLASVGVFLTEESPAFLAVVPTERLLALHRSVHEALQGLGADLWPYYKPGSILPHCTLSIDPQRRRTTWTSAHAARSARNCRCQEVGTRGLFRPPHDNPRFAGSSERRKTR